MPTRIANIVNKIAVIDASIGKALISLIIFLLFYIVLLQKLRQIDPIANLLRQH